MTNYALTYPQLICQARDQGVDPEGLRRLRETYAFVERMVDGLYRAQGVPFSCHLVRAASIALRLSLMRGRSFFAVIE